MIDVHCKVCGRSFRSGHAPGEMDQCPHCDGWTPVASPRKKPSKAGVGLLLGCLASGVLLIPIGLLLKMVGNPAADVLGFAAYGGSVILLLAVVAGIPGTIATSRGLPNAKRISWLGIAGLIPFPFLWVVAMAQALSGRPPVAAAARDDDRRM